MMRFFVDLRYLFVPPIGFALRFLLISQSSSPWPQNGDFKLESLGLPMFLLTFFIIVSLILLCLVISVKFDLTLGRFWLQTGDVSGPLTILLLASLILPLSFFWLAYLMLLILSPCSGPIFHQLKRFVYWFWRSFRATFYCIIRHQEESEPRLPPVVTQLEVQGSNNA